MTTWLIIIGMAIITFLLRAGAFFLFQGEIAPWLQRWLGYVPIAVFTALVLPPLLHLSNDPPSLEIGPALLAGIVGALGAWRTHNVLLTIAAGLVVFWALRWAGL